MRKLLLFVILLGFSINTKAQINTVIFEDFEAPSLDDQIDSTYSVRLSNGTVSNFPFSVTNQVATSGTNSYHAQGSDGHSSFFRTISFSTINFRYTTLKFNHIAKVSNLNGCYLTVSTDGGTTWKQINGTQYRGASKAYEATGFFNESSYFTLGDPWRNGVYAGANSVPNNTWWRLETFDISDLVYDVPNNTGYPNVIVRFEMRVTQGTPSGIPPAGWFIDDLEIEQAACELTPPKLEFGFNPIPCYFYNPVGPIPEQPGDKYAVGIQAFDPSNIDSVFLYYRSTSPPGQPFQRISLPLYSPSDTLYQDTIRNVFVGDTIEYYYVGWDGSCNPNMSRMPAVAGNYYIFWPEPALPDKCGPNTCTQFPELIQLTNLPWVEDFEDQRWGAGNGGATTAGNAHRGEFPVFYPDGNWTVAPPVTAGFENRYAWCVNSGGTSTPGTGPLSNHTQGGSKYLFAESSLGSNTAVQSTQIITPCIDLTQETRCLAFEFWYHMFGEDVDLLRIDVDTGSGTANWVIEYRKILGEQQKANTDPWKRFVFPLEDFNGKYVRIRLLAAKRPGLGGPRGDIAVDDFRIFEPDPVDIEVQSLNEPKNGYCYFDNQEPVIIEVRNNGCQTATNIPVAFEVSTSTGTSAVQWDTIKTPLVLGDTLTYTFTPKADLSAYNTYWVKAWATMPGDVNTSNDMVQVRDSIEYTLPISSFPYIEDFEDGIIQSQDIGNDLMRFSDGVITFYKWLVNRGLTPSLGQSGPFEGFGYGGKYLYTRSLVNDNQSSSTYVRTVCVDLGGMTSPVIEFYYHMFGDAIESLELEVSRAEEDLDTWTPIPGSKITGAQQTGSLSDWKYKKVHLGPEYLGETIKIRFKATRKSITMPTPAHPDYVDMAIDKVMIFDEIANDAGILSINTPVLHGEAGTTFNPSIKVTNHGTANIASVPLTIKVTPLCGPNAGQSTTYTDVATASVTPGNTSAIVNLTNTNAVFPDGEFELCVITQLGGDSHSFNDTICKRLIGHGTKVIEYKTDFDTCDYSADGFYFEGPFRQWELGRPRGARIRNSFSSPNAWVTNLDGSVIPGTDEFLYVPDLINFDTIVKPAFRFRQNMDFPANADDAKTSRAVGGIQYQEIIGGTPGQWKYLGKDVLGLVIAGVKNLNWYDSEFGSVLLNQINDNPGFVGRTNGGWIQTSFVMTPFDETPGTKRFRFIFSSAANASGGNEGWGIDDFEIYVPPQNSIGVVRFSHVSPIAFPLIKQDLKLTVRNSGAKPLDSAKIRIVIDNKPPVVDTLVVFSPPLLTGQQITMPLRGNQAWQAPDVTVGNHTAQVFTSRPNGKIDNYPIDNDTTVIFTVLDTVDLRAANGVTQYCNDFERTNPDIRPWLPTNTYVYQEGKHSWQWGFPAQFGVPPSGQNAWVTGLDKDYTLRDSSSLISPIFVIDSGQTMNVSFKHWFRTERLHDGGNFEVSFDGGLKWQPVGFKFTKDTAVSWYNTPFVAALDIIRPGWSGDSKGWISSNWPFAFDEEVKCIFRFRFESDYDNRVDNGWAIDDFCLEHSTLAPRQVIGIEETPFIDEAISSDLSPNPTKGMAELSLYLPSPKQGQLVIINSVGQMMEKRDIKFENGDNRIELNGSNWDSGMYIVKLYVGEDVITKKLIIAR